MTQALDDRIEDYLDGRLSDEETRQFEHDLLREEVACAFREALLMRELLGSLPPDEPPPGLIERIQASLNLDAKPSKEKALPQKTTRFGTIVNGLRWGVRWPGYALAGMFSTSHPVKASMTGLNTVGYVLGPLQEPARRRIRSIRLPKRKLLKMAMAKMW